MEAYLAAWNESLKAPPSTYLDYSKYTELIKLTPGKLLGSRVTWVCHNPEPGDIIRVATSPDRITWVDVPVNGGPAPGIRQHDRNVWARAMVRRRRLHACDVAPVMDLNVSIDIDGAEV